MIRKFAIRNLFNILILMHQINHFVCVLANMLLQQQQQQLQMPTQIQMANPMQQSQLQQLQMQQQQVG